jgi:hypothetical protein
MPPLALAEVEARRDRAIIFCVPLRQSLDIDAELLKSGCGSRPNWMPTPATRRAVRNPADAVLAATQEAVSLAPAVCLPVRKGRIKIVADQAIDLICGNRARCR